MKTQEILNKMVEAIGRQTYKTFDFDKSVYQFTYGGNIKTLS